jgi:hypothetical protein
MMKMGSINVEIKNSKNIQEFVDAQKRFNSEQSEAIKLEKQKNAEIEKAWKLEEKRQQKEKESRAKQETKEQEAAMKKLNAESEKRLRSIEKESAYLKKNGEEYVKLTRNVQELKVKSRELELQYGANSKATIAANKEFQEQKNKLDQLNKKMGDHQVDVGKYGKVWEGLKGTFVAVSAAFTAVVGVIAFAKSVFTSNEEGMDSWKIATQQATDAYQVLLTTIRTGDWSNFLTNIRQAILEGKRYAETLDELEKRKRSLDVAGTATQAKIAEYKVYSKTGIEGDKQLSLKERLAYNQKALDLEKQYNTDKKKLSEQDLQNEIDHLKSVTKLSEEEIKLYVSSYGTEGKLSEDRLKRNKEISDKIKAIRPDMALQQTGEVAVMVETKSAESKINDFVNTLSEAERATYKITKAMESGALDPKYIDKTAKSWENLNVVTGEYWTESARMFQTQAKLSKGILDEDDKARAKQLKHGKTKLQLLDEEVKKLTEKMNVQIAAGDKGAAQTAMEIVGIQKEILELGKLEAAYLRAAAAKSENLGNLQTFQPKGTKSIIAPNDSRMGAPIGNLTGPDITGGGIEEEKSPDEIALEKELKVWEQRLEMTSQFVSAINELVSSIYENEFQKIDEAASKDEENRARELKLAGDNKKSQDQINAKYDQKEAEREKEKKKLKHDQAVYDKAISAVNIGINTAVAAMQAYAQLGPIAGTVAAILVIAFGAIQLAAVLATNIPSYAKGRKGGPEELAKVHRGEMIISDNKSFLTPDVAESLAILPAGADVIPASEVLKTAGRLATQPIRNEKQGIIIKMEDKYGKEMLSEMKKEKPQTRIYTENGYTVRETGNYRLLTRV